MLTQMILCLTTWPAFLIMLMGCMLGGVLCFISFLNPKGRNLGAKVPFLSRFCPVYDINNCKQKSERGTEIRKTKMEHSNLIFVSSVPYNSPSRKWGGFCFSLPTF